MNDQAPITATTSKTEALARRYGADALPAAGPWNQHLDLLLSHRSVRGYRPDALPAGTLETLVAAAQSAATSSNMQTWSVVAVTDPATKAVMAKVANNQKHIEQCPLFLVWLADLSRNRRLAAAEGAELVTPDYLEGFLVAAIDAALAAQNAVVAAESLGLSTVYIGALRNDPLKVAEVLGLPAGAMGVFGLCVGYATPEAEAEVKPRLAQDAVLFREKYGNPDEPALRAAYDAKLAAFSRQNEMAETTWTGRVINRFGTLAAMNGRDRLAEIVRAMGFPLR
ncbi:NADPH-dependent oxidoreductase [Thalassobaculum fulvum]|uniref:NADPH-dependent oxidoreductase n=1 Tax=Thalassobaculum fulvum TaxID=1633335 RepID=A0A918XSN6_9PROT|nr:nitroreductase family protein [Thalassobaculum fulvum]GHD50092.1 NADPH-dependent oxidoreductase [Thalassobaculum fulvum]